MRTHTSIDTHVHVNIYITFLIDFRYYLGHPTVWSKQRKRQIFATPSKRNDQVEDNFSLREPSSTWSSSATAQSCGSANLAVLVTTGGKGELRLHPAPAAWLEQRQCCRCQILLLAGHSVLCTTVIQRHTTWLLQSLIKVPGN